MNFSKRQEQIETKQGEFNAKLFTYISNFKTKLQYNFLIKISNLSRKMVNIYIIIIRHIRHDDSFSS